MRLFMCVLLVVAVAATAGVKTGGSGQPNPWSSRGTYTVDDILAGGLTGSYGLAIKTNASNSIWILDWGLMENIEFDMVGGSATGNTWAITGGVDPDDQGYCEFSGGNQWFMTDYGTSSFGVFAEDGTWLRNIDGPAGYTNLFGIDAGHGMVYVGSPNDSTLAWGAYTGTETTIAWTGEMTYESVYGLAVYGDYLFVACGIVGADNVFIHEIASDGTPGATPVWTCEFIDSVGGDVNGGIDYDGTNLWLYPQNDFLYKLTIDFTGGGALEQNTWAAVKSSF